MCSDSLDRLMPFRVKTIGDEMKKIELIKYVILRSCAVNLYTSLEK